jgi:hypothetical protein
MDQAAILTLLYTNNNGREWVNKINWLSENPCIGKWYGVLCSSGNRNIVEVSLNTNSLSGIIVSELGMLSYLTGLHLKDNRIRGNIPVEFFETKSLQDIELGLCQLTGTLPSEVIHVKW